LLWSPHLQYNVVGEGPAELDFRQVKRGVLRVGCRSAHDPPACGHRDTSVHISVPAWAASTRLHAVRAGYAPNKRGERAGLTLGFKRKTAPVGNRHQRREQWDHEAEA
jgi:hypothetical protein